MSMEGLREGAKNIGAGKGKGPMRTAVYARWKPPAMSPVLNKYLAAPPHEESVLQVAEPVIIIPGQYADVYARDESGQPINPPPIIEAKRFKAHTFPVTKNRRGSQQTFRAFVDIVCSAGPDPHVPQPCLGCHEVDKGADSKPKDQWAFNIAHLAYYHSRPYVKDGQIQMKKDQSGPVMIKDECLSYKLENVLIGRAQNARDPKLSRTYRECEGCKTQASFAWGDHRVLQVGWGHLKTILAINDELGKKCVHCGTGIIRVAFNCGNPNCSIEVLDVAQVGWTNEQVELFSKSPFGCHACQQSTIPVGVWECGFDERYQQTGQGCPEFIEPRKIGIQDAVLWLQREGEGTDTEIKVVKYELIKNFKLPDGRTSYDGRPLEECLKEIVPAQYNLDEMYGPDDLDTQAERIQRQNPYAQPQQNYQSYGPPTGMPPAPGMPGMPPVGMPQQNYGQQAPAGQSAYPPIPGGRPNYGK